MDLCESKLTVILAVVSRGGVAGLVGGGAHLFYRKLPGSFTGGCMGSSPFPQPRDRTSLQLLSRQSSGMWLGHGVATGNNQRLTCWESAGIRASFPTPAVTLRPQAHVLACSIALLTDLSPHSGQSILTSSSRDSPFPVVISVRKCVLGLRATRQQQ